MSLRCSTCLGNHERAQSSLGLINARDTGEITITVHRNQASGSDRIRIVHILEATFGGTRKHLMYLATRLDRSRFDVTVICSTLRNPSFTADIETLLGLGIRVKVIQMRRRIHPWSDFVAFTRLYLFLRNGSYDIVHAHSSKAGFIGRIAARLARVPVILYTPHAFSFHRGILGTRRLYLFLERFAALFTDTIVAVSEGERELALRYGVAGSGDVVVIRNGVDLTEFDVSVNVDALGKHLGIEGARKTVGMVGRVCAQKGYRYFIEAASEVAKVRSGVRFVMVGSGDLDDAMRRIDGCGVRGIVSLTGQRSDLPALYALFDVLVVPSLWEGLPYVILEAMAMRRAVIATMVPGNSEVVLNGRTGYLVRPGDSKALAGAIVELLDDSAKTRSMGEHGREEIERRYTVEEKILSFERLYGDSVQRARKR